MKKILPFTLLLVLFSCKKEKTDNNPQPNSNLYFPPNGSSEWASTSPQSMGWNTSELNNLFNYLQGANSRAFIILKDGKIAVEQYWGQNRTGGAFNQNSSWQWASAGKTLTAFVVGKAQAEKKLDINQRTSTYLGNGWTSLSSAKEALITVRHQLSMTTGLDDAVPNSDNTAPASLQYKADAGTRWAYHNAPYTLLQAVVTNAVGQPFNNYFDAKLKSPIGMDGQWADLGDNHVYFSTPRSAARFGLLMLANGVWKGNDVMGDAAYIKQLTTTSQAINPGYGFLWWLNGKDKYMVPQSQIVFTGALSPDAPADMFAALGKDGQMICVVPSKNLVVVRMGDGDGPGLVSISMQNEIWARLKKVIP